MTFYSDLAADALALLIEFGQTVTRRTYIKGTYDADTLKQAITHADTSRSGVLLSFGQGKTTTNGQLIETNDKRLLLDATGVVLSSDVFVVGGVEYTVVGFDEISPAGTPVLFDIHVRLGAGPTVRTGA